MNPYTLTLSDPLADLETVGGKGMSLAKLDSGGIASAGRISCHDRGLPAVCSRQ